MWLIWSLTKTARASPVKNNVLVLYEPHFTNHFFVSRILCEHFIPNTASLTKFVKQSLLQSIFDGSKFALVIREILLLIDYNSPSTQGMSFLLYPFGSKLFAVQLFWQSTFTCVVIITQRTQRTQIL